MIVPEDLGQMAAHVVEQFTGEDVKIATAESCTGGLIAALVTSVAGSSATFERGFVTYSNEAKHDALGVPNELLAEHGAVSAPVAAEMALGAIRNSAAGAAVSVTGIAGPAGGTEQKPVGLVYIGVATRGEDGAYVEEFRFPDEGRDAIRNDTVRSAFELLLAYGLDDKLQ